MEIIIGRLGTQKTPIADKTVSKRHCKVTDNNNGTYTIENLSQTGTKVDGVEIIKTTASLNSRIQLGPQFSSTLVELIGAPSASKAHAPQPPRPSQSTPETKTCNIAHLRRVWEDFNNTNIELADAQRKTNLIRTGLGIFTMCAMPTLFFLGPIGYALTGIGVLGNIYSFSVMKNAETAEERQRRQDAFDDAWVCPNCGRSLMAKNYKLLVRNVNECPYCKCKYEVR